MARDINKLPVATKCRIVCRLIANTRPGGKTEEQFERWCVGVADAALEFSNADLYALLVSMMPVEEVEHVISHCCTMQGNRIPKEKAVAIA